MMDELITDDLIDKAAKAGMGRALRDAYIAGLKEAAEIVKAKFDAHGWDYHLPSVGREMASLIEARISHLQGEA